MKILIAVDRESATPVVDFLLMQGWMSGTEFRIATVYDTTSPEFIAAECSLMPYLAERELGEKYQALVDQTVEKLKAAYPHALVTFCLLQGDVAESLSIESQKWKADLIAIGSHQKRGLEKLLNGSVSQSVLHLSSCSILVVPIKTVTNQKDLEHAVSLAHRA